MFYGCSSLKEIPDISKWDTNQIEVMKFLILFRLSSKVESSIDISIWNNIIAYIFEIILGFSNLESLSDMF
jgi:surface protein